MTKEDFFFETLKDIYIECAVRKNALDATALPYSVSYALNLTKHYDEFVKAFNELENEEE